MHDFLQDKKNQLTPQKIEMFFMVCYNIDAFKDFVFKSSFLDRFEVEQETLDQIKDDDVALLRFGYRWLRFALFGEKTMTVKDAVFADKRAEFGHEKAPEGPEISQGCCLAVDLLPGHWPDAWPLA